uniref:Tudor domain-containing protein n=1 Tax=Rhabditophanes sp. KR3021 TaxID=114890 RepID=A0AC35TRW6_9BILA
MKSMEQSCLELLDLLQGITPNNFHDVGCQIRSNCLGIEKIQCRFTEERLAALYGNYKLNGTKTEKAQTILEAVDTQEKMVSSNAMMPKTAPIGLSFVVEADWVKLPVYVRSRLTFEKLNEFVNLINTVYSEKGQFLAMAYFKMNKPDKVKYLELKDFSETKVLAKKEWVSQEEVMKLIGDKDKALFVKNGMGCLKVLKKIHPLKVKDKDIIVLYL